MANVLGATGRSIDAQLPLTQVQTMERAVSDSEAPRRFNTALISAFAIAAVLLAALGIYSVIAFSVALRAQEMAIRIALGSQRSEILGLIFTSAAKLAVGSNAGRGLRADAGLSGFVVIRAAGSVHRPMRALRADYVRESRLDLPHRPVARVAARRALKNP